jgi:hypothetical protein
MKNKWWVFAVAFAGAGAIGALCWRRYSTGREADSTREWIDEADTEMRKIELKLLSMEQQTA